jgi:hypothetical protein
MLNEKIYQFMQCSYWENKRPKDKIEKSIENSLCYVVYVKNKQIGFARVITDGTFMYWLCDVYIDKNTEGRGLGRN